MPKIYRVRNKDNNLKMDLPDGIAQDVIDEYKGKWRTAKFAGGLTSQQYVLAEGSIMEMTRRDGTLRLYLWAGDKICVEAY